jgi:hypothetical protein
MIEHFKPVEELTVDDVKAAPVWEFINDDSIGETMVRPVTQLPVENLDQKLAGTIVRLANGTLEWAIIGNVDSRDPRRTEQFLTLSLERDGKWFFLQRYFDVMYAVMGPDALAQFLGLPVDDVFPIAFDLRLYSDGDPAALMGSVLKEPREKLSEEEIMALIFRKRL